MTTVSDADDVPRKRGSKLPLLLGLLLALIGAGGGYFAVQTGLFLGPSSDAEDGVSQSAESEAESITPAPSFVQIDPLVVSIRDTGNARLLRFSAQLEVAAGAAADVQAVMPRIVDVINGYLRAVALDEFSDPAILERIRGQLLRRIQVASGPDQVLDLLIMEFVLN